MRHARKRLKKISGILSLRISKIGSDWFKKGIVRSAVCPFVLHTRCATRERTTNYELYFPNDMDYFILTGSAFFRYISRETGTCDCRTLYNEFSETVFSHCTTDKDYTGLMLTLIYTEIELQALCVHRLSTDTSERREYAHKAMQLVRRTLELLKKQVPPLLSSGDKPSETPTTRTLRWTGNAIDLVEMIYGIHEMGCINDGEIPLKQLAPALYSFFGVETKDCYRFYTDIKRRKTVSHTQFLEQMQARLNERIRRDEEAELKRR